MFKNLAKCVRSTRTTRSVIPCQQRTYSSDLSPLGNFFPASVEDAFSRMDREFRELERAFFPFRTNTGNLQRKTSGAQQQQVYNFVNVAMDIKETPVQFEIHAEVPGAAREDLKLEYNDKNGVVTLSGEIKVESREPKEGTYHTLERRHGAFSRSVSLPASVSVKDIKAQYKDGVLTVVLPKVTKEEPKKVDIKID